MQKDDSTWLRTGYSVFALLVAFVFWKVFIQIGLKTGWLERYEAGIRVGSVVLSIACGAGVAWWLASDKGRNEYFLASVGEIRKIQWPDWEQTKKLTLIVCVVVAVFSVILTVFDIGWARLLKLLLV